MKITISNKTCEEKPQNKGLFFSQKGKNPFIWNEVNITLDNFQTIVENGYTISYNWIDNTTLKRKGNFKDTSFIVVDVDATDYTDTELVDKMKYKPTMWHTTFSHKTINKDYKNCYHFYFFFDDTIKSEKEFNYIYSKVVEGIEDIYDKAAQDCHRCTFTSNKKLDNFKYSYNGNILNLKSFNYNDNSNNVISFSDFLSNSGNCPKINSSNILDSQYKILENSKIGQHSETLENTFFLEESFFADLNTLQRSVFIAKYSPNFVYLTSTFIEDSLFQNGYADLRAIEYYEVPSAQYRWSSTENKPIIPKVENGHRTYMLYYDAIAFMKIIPNITKEHLVWLLVKEVYEHYLNGDGQMSNYFIIEKAKQVWNNIDNISMKPIKKAFKVDMYYWKERGISKIWEVVKNIRKQIKDNDFGDLYDASLTVEDNIEVFKEYGVNTTKKTLINWLESNGIDYVDNKTKRNELVIYYYNEDNNRSSREIQKLMNNHNIKVTPTTIIKIISDYKLTKLNN